MSSWAVTCRVYPLNSPQYGSYHCLAYGSDSSPNMSIERIAPMDESKTSAPDKHKPHTFEPSPGVPLNPRAGATQGAAGTEGTDLPQGSGSNCALCGAPIGDQLHIKGKAEADAESPKWGL